MDGAGREVIVPLHAHHAATLLREGTTLGHYAKLAVLALRCLGMTILLYAIPMILFIVIRVATGTGKQSTPGSGSVLLAWLAYALAGLILVTLARPLAHFASRGLDEPRSGNSIP